jgi:hypothetical protein
MVVPIVTVFYGYGEKSDGAASIEVSGVPLIYGPDRYDVLVKRLPAGFEYSRL